MSLMIRHNNNPIIKPSDITPSSDNFLVKGSFNPGAIKFNNEAVLILRIAEVIKEEEGYISVPYFEFENGGSTQMILRLKSNDPELKLKDTRGLFYKGKDYLSTYSHLRLARSKGFEKFLVEDKPLFLPSDTSESYGTEDARIALIDGNYYISYTGVSTDGYVTKIRVTKDFKYFENLGTAFCPLNKDVSFFEEKINGKYIALHRPHNQGFGNPSIWYAESPDMIHWGNHKCILRPNLNEWEGFKVGGGGSPIKTSEGWLVIYHGKGDGEKYSLNTLLLDLEDPKKIISKGSSPFMVPTKEYEKTGFFGNVIFSNGHILDGNNLYIYYGACDEITCLCKVDLKVLIDHSLGKGNLI